MEVWIGTDNDKIKLPITPSVLGVDRSSDIDTESIVKLGEVDNSNGMKLKTIDLEGFFPKQDYGFINNKLDPYEYSDKLQKWMYAKTVLRITITETPTNMLCKIKDFNTREQNGTRDLYFELYLLEHKNIEIPNLSQVNRPVSNNSNVTQRTHKVVKGDNLWDISHKYYGKGSIYKKINEANKSKYPSLSNNNIIYPNWILVIP